MERGPALFLEGRVGGVALSRERVEVPGEVAEAPRLDAGRVLGEGVEDLADLLGKAAGARRLDEVAGVLERDDDVGDLDARVVEVVLDLDPAAEPLERAHEDVAEDGVSRCPMCAALFGLMFVCSTMSFPGAAAGSGAGPASSISRGRGAGRGRS